MVARMALIAIAFTGAQAFAHDEPVLAPVTVVVDRPAVQKQTESPATTVIRDRITVGPVAVDEATAKADFAACDGQKFEFKGREKRSSTVRLCSMKDMTKDQITGMLESVAATIKSDERIPTDERAALIAQMKAKVLEIQSEQ